MNKRIKIWCEQRSSILPYFGVEIEINAKLIKLSEAEVLSRSGTWLVLLSRVCAFRDEINLRERHRVCKNITVELWKRFIQDFMRFDTLKTSNGKCVLWLTLAALNQDFVSGRKIALGLQSLHPSVKRTRSSPSNYRVIDSVSWKANTNYHHTQVFLLAFRVMDKYLSTPIYFRVLWIFLFL